MLAYTRPWSRQSRTSPNNLPNGLRITRATRTHRSARGQKLSPHKQRRVGHSAVIPRIPNSPLVAPRQLAQVGVNVWGVAHSAWGVTAAGLWFQSPHFQHYSVNAVLRCARIAGWAIWTTTSPASTRTLVGRYTPNPGEALLARSCGTLVWAGSQTHILLPSGHRVWAVPGHAYIGIPQSAGARSVQTVSQVRGIAKNPVDHPNGGRANTKGSFKTPWGSYAKAGK